jgi:putative ABC transport system permease protein
MSFVARGAKNAFRNVIRTASIVIILALSTGLALTMLLSRQAVQAKIDSVKASIGNTITVSPAGARGFQGGGEPLLAADIAKIKTTAHVVNVTATLTDQLSTADTNLASSIDAGTLGGRQNRQFQTPPQTTTQNGRTTTPGSTRTFTPPVGAVGSDDVNTLQSFGGGTITLTSGDRIDPTADANVAMVGKGVATKNNLSVGSTFTAYTVNITVKGIFDAGNTFANNAVVFSLPTLQRLSGLAGSVTQATVQVDSIENMASTTTAISSLMGAKADVVSQQDTSTQALAPLENIKNITLYSLLGAVVSGAIIIFLTMLMIVRERRREIGVFKAIGASNLGIVIQFISESMVLTLLGSVVGVVAGALFSNSVVSLLVTNATANQTQGGAGGGRGLGRALLAGGQSSIRAIHTTVGFSVLLYGLVGAVIIALLGSAIPAYLTSRIRPAEVMRGE